ncbi:hypothetical protein XELAEV_18042062mg [Xenopus laevis]|uniref:Uncharacterized protein n=1 Tax=Xenopus laevis TaxID=8355 RepID=A0A974C3C7_XENLA|nr:hypothetical protein XELAEV_18042062mg [Xenopus laevis]
MLDTGWRYLWTGLFGQKLTSRGAVRLLPLRRCQRLFFHGPLFVRTHDSQERQQLDRRLQRWENKYPITVAEATQTIVTAVADFEPLPMETSPPSYREEPAAVEPAVSTPTPGERECSVAPSSRESVKEIAASRPSLCQEERETRMEKAVVPTLSPVPEGSVANNGEGAISGVAAATTPTTAVTPSPHYLLINDVDSFWKKMNLEVSKRWGYYMPYTLEQVYLEVSLLLEDWINEDILVYLKMDRVSLIHHDCDARRRAKDLVQEKLPMWWLGRTILRTYVRSICKRAPERHYSKDVPNNKGGYTEKPHPAYYVSFEDTKTWFHKMI